MPVAAWRRFQKETANVLRALGDVRTVAVGRFAGSQDWQGEDTALFVIDTALGSGEITRAMAHLLARYRQDAVGIIEGKWSEGTRG